MSERTILKAKTSQSEKQKPFPRVTKTNSSPSNNSPFYQILYLQRTMGNHAVERLLKSGVLQAKPTIGQPGDIYEQEANRIAKEVMRMPDLSKAQRKGVSEHNELPSIQRMCTECEEDLQRQTQDSELGYLQLGDSSQEELHRQPTEEEEELLQTKEVSGSTREVSSATESQINSVRGGGQPLPESVRAFFEPRFGQDFSQVRIHTDSNAGESAKAVNAVAYTVGQDVVFSGGQYSPETESGKKLIAHELTHVVQQKSNTNSEIRKKVLDDDAHVPCRSTRADAVKTLKTAEEDAIKLARRAAVIIYVHRTFHPLAQIAGESPGLRAFRDVLWRRFHFDFNRAQVRDTLLPIWERRFELVADWIRRLNHRYICGAPGVEPPGDCTTRPGEGFAWTGTGENRTQLCDDFWGRSAEDLAGSILHEWFHFGFDWLGDCEQTHNRNNNKCYDMFARELAGTASPSDYETCCPPPSDPLPPLAKTP